MQPNKAVLDIRDLSKSVQLDSGELTILKESSFSIHPGERVAIVGKSGSGKTTLLGLLAGLDLPTTGSVAMMGQDLSTMTEDQRAELRAKHVGFVFQSFQLLPTMTALENVLLPLELAQDTDAENKAIAFLKQMGLEDRINHYPSQLSGGEQQRVAMARAFASKPDILFADEPTGNLDTATGQQIVKLLFEYREQTGASLVLVTHDQALADLCDRQFEVVEGRVKEILGEDESPRTLEAI